MPVGPAETLAAAEAVTGPEVLDGLASLVEHSMVTADLEAPGEPRFRMLQAVRAFLRDELQETPQAYAEAMDRLAGYVGDLAEQAGEGLRSGRSRSWRSRGGRALSTSSSRC